jgi:hypothetical protein
VVTERLSADAAALVLWIDIFGAQADDRLRVQIMGPNGHIILDQARQIEGLHRQSRQWPSGTYQGTLQLQRGSGANALTRIRVVSVQIP